MQRLLILAFVLIAVSCSRPDATKPRIGLVPRTAEDTSGAAIRDAIEAAAEGKAELAVAAGGGALHSGDARALSLFDGKLLAIAVDPVDDSLLDAVIKRAKADRVPVVFFGREPSRQAMRSWDKLFFVGTRPEDTGSAQGELLVSAWKANPTLDRNKDGALQFVALTAANEGPSSARQAETVAKTLSAAGVRSVMLAQDAVEEGVDAARKRAAAIISVYGGRIEAFVCRDDDMALGAAEALKAAGYATDKRRVPVVGASVRGSNELPAAVADAIRSDALVGTVVPDEASQGEAVFELSYALARGIAPWRSALRITDAKYVWIPCRKLTKADFPRKN
jgi:methyl-galactoside transport system substrate-binding protein